MDTITEVLRLLRRQSELQTALRQARGSHVLEERELYLIRQRLAQFPSTVQTVGLAAAELHRPIDTLTARDVEKHC
jgi:hypothetical protein